MNKMDIDEDSNLLIMGNCQEQFENIKDDFSEVSERNRIYNTIITDQHHSLVNPYLSPQPKVQEKTSRVIDQELLHSTVFKRNLPSESKIQLKTKLSFPQDSKFDTKDNAKLQQLDFTFYNQLALSDYQFQDIPFESKREYNGLETVQQKDSHGVKYIGQWKDGLLHGNGILISNTFKYIGQFKNGLKQFHGREIFTHQVYEGEFDAGRRKGRGVRYTEDYTQIGIFDGNIIYGIITYSNDDLYKGSLKNNRYDGIGFNVQQLQAGQIKQVQTQFKRIFHDQYLRRSFEKWQKQKKQNRDDGLGNKKYQKQTDTWYQNCHYDQGDLLYARVKYSNGNIYEGQLNNMSKHGKGKYLWKDGSTYEGQYFKDEKHGRGTLKTVLKIGSKIVEKQYRDRQFVNGIMKDQIQESVIEDQGSEIPNLWQ